jgi:hypothetical protein
MQEAEEPARGGTGTQAAEPARMLSPIAAFLILLAIAAVGLGALLLSREERSEEPSAPDRGPAFALTDEEAIELFKELEALQIRAYRERDLSLISKVYVPGGQGEKVVAEEIRKLIRADVLDRSTFRTERIELIRNDGSQVIVRQTEVQRSRFVHESGEDVTTDAAHQRLVVDWYLTRVGDQWFVEKELIVRAEDLPDREQS